MFRQVKIRCKIIVHVVSQPWGPLDRKSISFFNGFHWTSLLLQDPLGNDGVLTVSVVDSLCSLLSLLPLAANLRSKLSYRAESERMRDQNSQLSTLCLSHVVLPNPLDTTYGISSHHDPNI